MPQFPRGNHFPNEGYVHAAIEAHFTAAGYQLLQEGFTDLACCHPDTGKRWVVEAKGHSTGQVPGGGVISAAMLSRAPDQATRAADGNAVTASASATPPPSSTSNFNKAIASTLR